MDYAQQLMSKQVDYGLASKQPERPPHVQMSLDQAEKAIQHLTEAIGRLGNRLDPVCRAAPPSTNAVTPAPPDFSGCPISARISQGTDQIRQLQMVLESLLDRLEL